MSAWERFQAIQSGALSRWLCLACGRTWTFGLRPRVCPGVYPNPCGGELVHDGDTRTEAATSPEPDEDIPFGEEEIDLRGCQTWCGS